MNNNERTIQNKRDEELEYILSLLNSTLEDDEKELTDDFIKPKYPPLFIVGNARSGTTLLYQWLASTRLFAYPSNIISRFYRAPYIGALIHKMFTEHDKLGELYGEQKFKFQSHLGKTKNPTAPHEFWYFWRRFFEFDEIQKLGKKDLSKVNEELFLKELAALEGAFNKPLLLKGMILNWNLSYLIKLMPKSIFIHLKRDELYNMHSLYKTRKEYFGDVSKWYSFKPPEYSFLKEKGIYEQLAGQVIYTNRAIENGLESCSDNLIQISYKSFCAKPEILYKKLSEKLNDKGYFFSEEYTGDYSFDNRNQITDSTFNKEKAQKVLKIDEE